MTFGERIQLLRKQRKMSQEELGEKLEVTRQTISKWELDQSTPDLDYIIAISEFFDVTTDYLIKGGRDENSTLRSQSALISAPQLQYCEDNFEDNSVDSNQPRYSSSPAAAISASSEYFVIKLNCKAILRTLWALLLMFAGFMGALVCVSFFFQPLTDDFERIILTVLSLVSAAVFITGLSFFANALLRYHIAFCKLCMKIRLFASDFVRAFRAVQLERGRSAQNRICEAANTYAENSEEISGEASTAAVEPDVGIKKNLVSNKTWGLLLTVMSVVGGFIDIVNISHFYDHHRHPFILLFELLFLLLALILFCVGIGLISNKRVKIVKVEDISACGKTEDSSFFRGQALNNEALEQRQNEKALKIKEKAEIKAAEIREMYRLRAEAFAPDNEAVAEQIIAKGEAKIARVMEKAEKKIGRCETGIGWNSRAKEKGAHLK